MDAARKAFRWEERSGQAERRAKASVSIPCVDVLVVFRRQHYSCTRAHAVSTSGGKADVNNTRQRAASVTVRRLRFSCTVHGANGTRFGSSLWRRMTLTHLSLMKSYTLARSGAFAISEKSASKKARSLFIHFDSNCGVTFSRFTSEN